METIKNEVNVIQRLKLLPSSNSEPTSINKDAKLKEAITLMMTYNYSQLPVIDESRNVVGYISWGTIGCTLSNGRVSDDLKDYIKTDITRLNYDMPLLDAIAIILEKEFVLVEKNDHSISGIVTVADLSDQFLSATAPCIYLEQIENHSA